VISTAARARPRPGPEAVPAIAATITVLAGLGIKAATGALGTPLPPFLVAWGPAADPLVIVSVVVLAAGAVLTPWLVQRISSPRAFAAATYALALALGLSLNLAHVGVRGWWSVFAGGARGSREAAFEYLPGLPALAHGAGFYIGHFAQLVPSLPLHAAGNPPGPLVSLYLLGIDSAGALGALCIGVGALAAPLAYDLGRVLGGEERGRVAGALTAFSPSLLIFGVTSADYAFTTLGVGAACLLARPRVAPRAAGCALAAFASFFSWVLLAIPAWAAIVVLKRQGVRPALKLASASGAAIVALNAGMAVAFGYDPIATLTATASIYGRTSAARPYVYWILGSPVAWAVMLGLPTARVAIRSVAARDSAALALVTVILVASVLGLTKAETERIWLPFVPLACVAAAALLRPQQLGPVLWMLVAQALAVELLFDTIW
jgi:hypothetical protein